MRTLTLARPPNPGAMTARKPAREKEPARTRTEAAPRQSAARTGCGTDIRLDELTEFRTRSALPQELNSESRTKKPVAGTHRGDETGEAASNSKARKTLISDKDRFHRGIALPFPELYAQRFEVVWGSRGRSDRNCADLPEIGLLAKISECGGAVEFSQLPARES